MTVPKKLETHHLYFLDTEQAYLQAVKQVHLSDAQGKPVLQHCYYQGPLTDIPLENFIINGKFLLDPGSSIRSNS